MIHRLEVCGELFPSVCFFRAKSVAHSRDCCLLCIFRLPFLQLAHHGFIFGSFSVLAACQSSSLTTASQTFLFFSAQDRLLVFLGTLQFCSIKQSLTEFPANTIYMQEPGGKAAGYCAKVTKWLKRKGGFYSSCDIYGPDILHHLINNLPFSKGHGTFLLIAWKKCQLFFIVNVEQNQSITPLQRLLMTIN